jgi:hypothetical protein
MKREPFTLDRFLLYMKFWRGMLRFFQTHYQ